MPGPGNKSSKVKKNAATKLPTAAHTGATKAIPAQNATPQSQPTSYTLEEVLRLISAARLEGWEEGNKAGEASATEHGDRLCVLMRLYWMASMQDCIVSVQAGTQTELETTAHTTTADRADSSTQTTPATANSATQMTTTTIGVNFGTQTTAATVEAATQTSASTKHVKNTSQTATINHQQQKHFQQAMQTVTKVVDASNGINDTQTPPEVSQLQPQTTSMTPAPNASANGPQDAKEAGEEVEEDEVGNKGAEYKKDEKESVEEDSDTIPRPERVPDIPRSETCSEHVPSTTNSYRRRRRVKRRKGRVKRHQRRAKQCTQCTNIPRSVPDHHCIPGMECECKQL